jgi:tyrosyl-tRNA synthetase
MSFQYDFETVKTAILFNTVEVIPSNPEELDKEIRFLVDSANSSGEPIKHYIGFEISGQIHIGTGLVTALKIKALQSAGIICSIYLANYHTWLNKKLDGKMETIIAVKDKYFEPVFKKTCEIVGCNVESINFVGAEKLYYSRLDNGYQFFDYMLKTAQNLTLARVSKSITVTGKKEGETVQFALLNYPVMQVADAYFMQTHLVHAGIDQRKCHVLMREVANGMDEGFDLKIGNKTIKPIAMHHGLLLSLGVDPISVSKRITTDVDDDSLKMSKSKPDSAVWVHDDLAEIQRKLKKAYCPMVKDGQSAEEIEAEQKFNPILNWCENLIFKADKIIEIVRPEKFGGNANYDSFEILKQDYYTNKLHAMDLKDGVARCLALWFVPILDFTNNEGKSGLELVKSINKSPILA